MQGIRQAIGGVGNLMFKQAFLWMLMREGAIPDIYVQGEKYWKKYSNEIKQMFGHGIFPRSIDKVAIHIRRGDYLKASQFHVALWDTDYYKKAVAMFPGALFLVFCKDNQEDGLDKADMKWTEEFMVDLGVQFQLHNHTTETDDLNTMASCKSLIMANSTFSWWAAYLGGHGKVICPKSWFTDGEQRCELLPEWTLI